MKNGTRARRMQELFLLTQATPKLCTESSSVWSVSLNSRLRQRQQAHLSRASGKAVLQCDERITVAQLRCASPGAPDRIGERRMHGHDRPAIGEVRAVSRACRRPVAPYSHARAFRISFADGRNAA